MEQELLELMLVTFVIHLIDTLAYSVRLNSVKSGQFALSLSLFNIFVLISRTANMLQGPLIGALIGSSILAKVDPLASIRDVIFASSVGTVAGILLIPSFLIIFSKALAYVDISGSVPNLVVEALNLNNIKRAAKNAAIPRKSMLSGLRYHEIPKRLLILNTLITGVYTVGVLAAFYAVTKVAPQYQLAVSASSGMINGVASILLTFFIDPTAAIITDQTYRGARPYEDVKALVVLLVGTKLLGTLLGQILIVPAADIIAWFYR